MQVIHEETQRFNLLMGVLVLATFLVVGIYLFWSWGMGTFQYMPAGVKTILIIVMILDLFIIANFFQLKIVVSSEQLIFGFGILKRKIRLTDIDSIKIEKFEFKKYMGYGIRVGRDKSLGYVAQSGDGIRIETPKRIFFITSDDAQQLKTMIENSKKSVPKAG